MVKSALLLIKCVILPKRTNLSIILGYVKKEKNSTPNRSRRNNTSGSGRKGAGTHKRPGCVWALTKWPTTPPSTAWANTPASNCRSSPARCPPRASKSSTPVSPGIRATRSRALSASPSPSSPRCSWRSTAPPSPTRAPATAPTFSRPSGAMTTPRPSTSGKRKLRRVGVLHGC